MAESEEEVRVETRKALSLIRRMTLWVEYLALSVSSRQIIFKKSTISMQKIIIFSFFY